VKIEVGCPPQCTQDNFLSSIEEYFSLGGLQNMCVCGGWGALLGSPLSLRVSLGRTKVWRPGFSCWSESAVGRRGDDIEPAPSWVRRSWPFTEGKVIFREELSWCYQRTKWRPGRPEPDVLWGHGTLWEWYIHNSILAWGIVAKPWTLSMEVHVSERKTSQS
jgi:hypothetical protein